MHVRGKGGEGGEGRGPCMKIENREHSAYSLGCGRLTHGGSSAAMLGEGIQRS